VNDDKIIQIIPAPSNLYCVFNDNETAGKEFESKVICLGLTNEGDIIILDLSTDGLIDDATTCYNFKEIRYK
jgi:hypothetical protein